MFEGIARRPAWWVEAGMEVWGTRNEQMVGLGICNWVLFFGQEEATCDIGAVAGG